MPQNRPPGAPSAGTAPSPLDMPAPRGSAPAMLALAGVLAAGAVLRFWGLGRGIPHDLGVDEPQIMVRVARMMATGDFNPHFFDYPGLYLYVQLVVSCARFLAGVFAGDWGSLAAVPGTEYYLWGRTVTALAGTLTVYVVYRAALRWGEGQALLAAGLLAVMPLHVRESHFILTDVPMTFFVALAFLATLRALEAPGAGRYAVAGAMAGLAAATKYYGAVVLVVPVAAAVLTRPGVFSAHGQEPRPGVLSAGMAGRAASVLGASAAAFLLAAPYTVLDLPGFLNGFGSLAGSFSGVSPPEPGWRIYLKHLRLAIGDPGMVLLAFGGAVAAWRVVTGPWRLQGMLLLLFPLLYFPLIASRSLIFGRYLLPIVPSVTILVAIGLAELAEPLRRLVSRERPRQALLAAAGVAVFLPPLVSAVSFDVTLTRPSTKELAYRWVMEHVPRGSKVVVEARGFELHPGLYQVQPVLRLIEHPEEYYASDQLDYAIASSEAFGPYMAAPGRFGAEVTSYARVFRSLELVQSFLPGPGVRGPEVRIYARPGVASRLR